MPFTLGPRAASAGYRLNAYDQIGSTNVEAMARARDGDRGSIWFVTSEQTAGRGRRQRAWIAPRGNLASSVLEVLRITPATAATLGFAAGLAMEAALRKVSVEAALRAGPQPLKYDLKWPNDVLAGGKKLVGISLDAEAVDDHLAVVVGIGTNVVAAPEGTPTPAISLAGARRTGRRRGVVLRIIRQLGRLPRHLGQRPRLRPRSEGSGSTARPASGRRLRSSRRAPRSKARSTPSTSRAA